MRISYNWLRQYVRTDLSPQQAAAILTSTGLECESVEPHEPVKGMLAGVVVGHVLQCDKHPDADRLTVCTVDIAQGEPLRIVCGAPNVTAGQKVLVATVGCTLNMTDGTSIVIKKSKIRGQESNGMICAEDELGLGQSHAGILVLDVSAVPGTPAADQLGLVSDHVLEIGLTPNRTDAMGHVGVARDLIAALNHRKGSALELQLPDVSAYRQDVEARSIKVEVRDAKACPRYAGVTLTQVKVGPSPKWLQDRLTAVGLKPINNVVDVTNFVQHELGQPLHAFDADALANDRIVVRMAAPGEAFTTLDGKERKLDAGDLVIADASVPACIAGVFGGAKSGVTEKTTSIFLESACFEPATIRRTARRHGLSTDASFRFERGVDPEITVYALKRAALLLKEVSGAQISSVITDIDHTLKHRSEVHLRFHDLEALSGLKMEPDAAVRILELLDFRIRERNAQGVHVQVPAYRVDVHRPADVIEEILRIHGLDNVPVPECLQVPAVHRPALTLESLHDGLAAHLVARGFREIMTPSLVGADRAHKLLGDDELVALANPLSSELDVLRPTMRFGVLQAMSHNINRQQRDLRFFERGRVYRRKGTEVVETESLSIALTGQRWREHWRAEDRAVEWADVKEEVESALARLGLRDRCTWQATTDNGLDDAVRILVDKYPVGIMGRVQLTEARHGDVEQPVYCAELDEEALLAACVKERIAFADIARFPAVHRDLSLVISSDTRFDQLEQAAYNAERKLLRAVELFDVYEGGKLSAGTKSYALRFTLQDDEKTLTDEQVEKAMGRIRKALGAEVGAEVRS
ncbi:MAG: phenylalanine--tRNA ligase subunit beta [Flavobacteriales bacterium]|nr:phenylalanine--tRNA ligase subunit beta [Flavobacteriales bacterium]